MEAEQDFCLFFKNFSFFPAIPLYFSLPPLGWMSSLCAKKKSHDNDLSCNHYRSFPVVLPDPSLIPSLFPRQRPLARFLPEWFFGGIFCFLFCKAALLLLLVARLRIFLFFNGTRQTDFPRLFSLRENSIHLDPLLFSPN